MPTEDKKVEHKIFVRSKENWFKELLIKLHILKPKYTELKEIVSIEEII